MKLFYIFVSVIILGCSTKTENPIYGRWTSPEDINSQLVINTNNTKIDLYKNNPLEIQQVEIFDSIGIKYLKETQTNMLWEINKNTKDSLILTYTTTNKVLIYIK